jgi:Ca2+:H+ antiporter
MFYNFLEKYSTLLSSNNAKRTELNLTSIGPTTNLGLMKKFISIQLLFVFIPVSLGLKYLMPEANALIFFTAALSIIPIAKLISQATENLAHYTGEAIGGLLNATFGNFPEFIIILMAVRAGLREMVLAALIGGILANLLLALGVSFLVGGLKHHTQDFNPVTSRVYATMMFIAVISMMVPSSFDRMIGETGAVTDVNSLNIGISIVLLVTYFLYLFFMIKTHPEFFKSSETSSPGEEHEKPWSIKKAVIALIGASVFAALMSEVLVGSAEATGESLGMTTTFIGLVILAIVGGAAESLSAITMAAKNKMDLTLSIAMGSCIQIALLLAPLAVLMSYFIGPTPLNLSFGRVELGALFLATIMGMMVSTDGKSNWYKGVQLIVIYLIIGILFFFVPENL